MIVNNDNCQNVLIIIMYAFFHILCKPFHNFVCTREIIKSSNSDLNKLRLNNKGWATKAIRIFYCKNLLY